jgi:hypothetical protein
MRSNYQGAEAYRLREGDPGMVAATSMPPVPPRAPLMQPQEAPPTGLSFGERATPAPRQQTPYTLAKAQLDALMALPESRRPPPGTPERKAHDDYKARLKEQVDYFEQEAKSYSIVDGHFVDPTDPTAPAIPIGGMAGGGIDTDLANSYRDDLRTEPEVANFRLVRQGFDTIESLYQNPGAVSDYALAVGFAKIVDPGSVAREGEVAAVQGSTALSDRLKQQVINALNGTGALPEESRKEIADLGMRFYNRSAERASTVLGSYRRRADRANIPFDEIWAGGDITMLPDDYLSTLTINANAKDRFPPPPPVAAPGPIQGPPPPPPPLPAPPPVARTMGDAMVPTQEQLTEAIAKLPEGQRRTLARIKGATNQIEYLRRLGALE